MYALNLLSEGTHETDLTWLLWLVLVVFVIIIIVGWMTSKKDADAAPAETHAPVHVEAAHEEAAPDDLTRLEGVGPKVSDVLAGAGYTTFAQLAAADADAVREVLKEAGLQMMEPAGWIEQADLAAKGDTEALAKLQDELKGGRHA